MAFAVSADGKQIATAGKDRTVRMWSTTYGDMVLSNLNTAGPVFGFYGSKNRKLEFPYITTDVFSKAQSLEGYWFGENPDYRMCATARDGSYYWGRVEFNFDEDSLAFTGKWSYCGITPGNTWNGTRIGAN